MSEKTHDKVVDELFKAGAHYGYSKTRRHPSTAKYIYTTKNRVDIIDIGKTGEQLAKAESFLAELGTKGKIVLFVGVKPEARDVVRSTAEAMGMPFVVERWVGGILTNWSEVKKRIAKLEDLKAKKEAGELDKYTKKERLLIDEEIAKMHKFFSGLVSMKKMPDAMFVVDPKREHIAVTEAQKMGIPVLGILNTDNDMKSIEYPILANDSSVSSITYFMEKISEAYRSSVAKSE